jgi:hypothetical protein
VVSASEGLWIWILTRNIVAGAAAGQLYLARKVMRMNYQSMVPAAAVAAMGMPTMSWRGSWWQILPAVVLPQVG